jgi:hypothetical protein
VGAQEPLCCVTGFSWFGGQAVKGLGLGLCKRAGLQVNSCNETMMRASVGCKSHSLAYPPDRRRDSDREKPAGAVFSVDTDYTAAGSCGGGARAQARLAECDWAWLIREPPEIDVRRNLTRKEGNTRLKTWSDIHPQHCYCGNPTIPVPLLNTPFISPTRSCIFLPFSKAAQAALLSLQHANKRPTWLWQPV